MLDKFRNATARSRPSLNRAGSSATSSPSTPPGLLQQAGRTSPQSEGGSSNGALDHMYNFNLPSPAGSALGASPGTNASAASWINQTDAYKVMARHIYKQAAAKNYFAEDPTVPRAVALRLYKGAYLVHPPEDPRLDDFTKAITAINSEVCIRVSAPVVSSITSRLAWGTSEIPLTPSDHVQVVETMQEAAMARKAQYACFVRQECCLLVWSESVDNVIERIQAMEAKMVAFVWKSATAHKLGGVAHPTLASFNTQQSLAFNGSSPNSSPGSVVNYSMDSRRGEPPIDALRSPDVEAKAMEKGVVIQERPTMLQAPIMHGLTIALDVTLIGLVGRSLLIEALADHGWLRFAILASCPPIFLLLAFFCGHIVSIVFMVLAPINQMETNSRYYSGVAPPKTLNQLPHITIQMPVYKEDLEEVIKPTVESLQKAISTYTLQGGSAAIIVSDDGMQLISEEEREIRKEFYDVNNISWVARPGHNINGFTRNGRFKKASNLNITLRLSMEADRMMDELRPKDGTELIAWTDADEAKLYGECLTRAIGKVHADIWACGSIRMGELILLIDSDTRVPADCLMDAASEMSQSPDVGIIQHYSGVMVVTGNMFEKGIAFFTRLVNFAISYCVANGDVAPFVGHNAFLRWSAMQEASFIDEADGIRKIWSESHVSEDFDMALRLLMQGYVTRWATYSKGEFQEGVSLTAEDELNRWQKYAFGCSELMFNPFRKWLFKGPITPLYRRFLWSKALPLHYKFAASSYMFSYYAIASAMPLTLALTLVQGWFYPTLDLAFLPPFNTWISVVVVFGLASPLATVLGNFRSKTRSLLDALRDHLTWTPFMIIFFTGLPMHVLVALLAHPLGINMTWGATLKSLGQSNFFLEIPLLFKRFWPVFLISTVWLAGIGVLGTSIVPLEWQIMGFFTIWPSIWLTSMHILYPFALNPALLRFSF